MKHPYDEKRPHDITAQDLFHIAAKHSLSIYGIDGSVHQGTERSLYLHECAGVPGQNPNHVTFKAGYWGFIFCGSPVALANGKDALVARIVKQNQESGRVFCDDMKLPQFPHAPLLIVYPVWFAEDHTAIRDPASRQFIPPEANS